MIETQKEEEKVMLGCYKNNGCVRHAPQTASRVSSSDMRIFAAVFVILVSTFIVNASILDPVIENVVHIQASKPPGDVPGIWKKKTIWKPRWVKEWKSAKVMKPVWRKVWSPVQIREWVPIPKPPPGWSTASTPLAPIKTTPKENLVPLWDPVPYPESQQPPPPSPQHYHQPDGNCGPGGCDTHTSQTFNHHQITEIIGSDRYKKGLDHHQSDEYSESVAHLTGIPTNWEQPQQQFDVQFADGFADYSELSPFLVPPRFQNILNYNQKESEFYHHHHHHHEHHDHHHHEPTGTVQITHSPGFEVNHIIPHRWTQLHAIDNNDEKRYNAVKTPGQPYKFHVPETYVKNVTTTSHKHVQATKSPASGPDGDLSAKPNFQTHKINKLQTERNPDFIQSSQLVGEYHYSEASLAGDVKPKPGKHQSRPEIIEQTRTRPKPVVQTGIKPHLESKPDFRPHLIETKPRPTKKENKKPQQRPPPVQNGPPNHQTHHSTPPKHEFEQTKADIQEIAPNFVVATPPIPPNHKPSPTTTERKVFTPPTTPIPPPPHPRAPTTLAPDNHSPLPTLETHSEKNFIVQVVYPTPQHHQKIPPFKSLPEAVQVPSETLNKRNPNSTRSRDDILTSETATIQSVTTSKPDAFTTKSSVFVVTPIYPEKS